MRYSKKTQRRIDRCHRLTEVALGWIHSPIQSPHSEEEAGRCARASVRVAMRLFRELWEPKRLPGKRQLSAEDGCRSVTIGQSQGLFDSLGTRK